MTFHLSEEWTFSCAASAIRRSSSPTRLQDAPYVNFRCAISTRRGRCAQRRPGAAIDAITPRNGIRWPTSARLFDADSDGRAELCYYNGYRAGIDIVRPADADHAGCGCNTSGPSAASSWASRTWPSTACRAAACYWTWRATTAPDARWWATKELTQALAADGIEIESGDMLVLRTGYAKPWSA